MGEFFHGWKRKFGVATLVLACVFAAGWMRSLTVQDQFFGQHHQSVHILISMDGAVSWMRCSPVFLKVPIRWQWISQDSTDRRAVQDTWTNQLVENVDWKWGLCGFVFGCASMGRSDLQFGTWTQRDEVWQAPYWSIVIPLIIISAYLLLSKPRPSTSMKINKHVPETVI